MVKNLDPKNDLTFTNVFDKHKHLCMSLINKTILIIVCLCGLVGCTTYCPEFDEKILSWIPYQENDVIELYSHTKESTIVFTIKSVEIQHTTHLQLRSKCVCSDYVYIRQNETDDIYFQVNIYLSENQMTSQSYQIGDTHFTTYSEIKNYEFEGKKYDVVRIFERNDSNGTFIKMIKAKDIGLIGLVDIQGNIWILKTNLGIRRLNEKKNIVINRVSC